VNKQKDQGPVFQCEVNLVVSWPVVSCHDDGRFAYLQNFQTKLTGLRYYIFRKVNLWLQQRSSGRL